MTTKLDWSCDEEGDWTATLPDGRSILVYWDDSDPTLGEGWSYRIQPAQREDEDRLDYCEESGALDGCDDATDYHSALRAAEHIVKE